MRILHVSDLHLGRSLGDLSRYNEQRSLVTELVTIRRELNAAVTVIAGDVFDAYTPPAWAEDLFFELIDGLSEGGTKAVLVISGNHDSGVRLAAADPLARRLGIILAGDVDGDLLSFEGRAEQVCVRTVGKLVVEVLVPGETERCIAALLPHLSEARVERTDENDHVLDTQTRFSRRLAKELSQRAETIRDDAINLLVMHQFVTGAVPSDSERRLRVGGLSDFEASAIPEGFQYAALGHLHRPQEVHNAKVRCVYAGSPIAYSFSEAGQQKRAVLVDINPQGIVRFESIPLMSGRPLEVWNVSSVHEAILRAKRISGPMPIVEIRLALGRRALRQDLDELPQLENVTVAEVRDVFAESLAPLASRAEPELRDEELFAELWRRRNGEAPDEHVMQEILSALQEVQGASLGVADPS